MQLPVTTSEAFLEVGGPHADQTGGFTGAEQGAARLRPKWDLLVASVPQAEGTATIIYGVPA